MIDSLFAASRPVLVATAVLGAGLALGSGDSAAQSWPTKPIHWVVPFTPGAFTDVAARLVTDKVAARLGQPVIVDNKPGAGGDLGARLVAKAPPDGYTVLLANHPGFTTAPALSKDPGFDPVRDYEAVTGMMKFAMLLAVHPSVPANDLKEFIAYVKSRPGQLNYSTPGVAMPHNLAMVLLKQAAGIDIVHIAYKGGAPATQDLVGGRVQAMFGSWVIVGPHMKSGKVKVVGVSTASRLALAPDIPTIAEQGYPGFDVTSWNGLFAPAGTPAAAVAKLHEATQAVLNTPEVREAVAKLGLETFPIASSAAFSEQVRTEVAKWGKIIRDANIKPE
ncbi:MAG: tripartite tricarboxylate transporter substrate binding protein [Betaproteobacteria bacterium]|nr:tripartite tricarboxylate transporter substrate binding protein [Betaproteobacteria bacterium]